MKRMLAFLDRVPRIPGRIFREVQHRIFSVLALAAVVPLWWRNRRSMSPVAGGHGPDVSLTTYGRRAPTVYLTIESIARGMVRPRRLILWLDEEALFEHLPAPLERLKKRGLEVRLTSNLGPHKKYYPYLESTVGFDLPLVTADDDILYPRRWLFDMMIAAQRAPGSVVCYRAHVMDMREGKIAPYAAWQPCRSTVPSARNFATGVSGVYYPPAFLTALKRAGMGFSECCPMADDVWLHAQALRHGFAVAQVAVKPQHFLTTPGTQTTALMSANWNGGGNDRQIAATYTAEDIKALSMERHRT